MCYGSREIHSGGICSSSDEAQKYYADDRNYEWYFIKENEEYESTYPILLSEREIEQIYDVEKQERELAIYFGEIEQFGILEKVSKDGIVEARTDFVLYDGAWYWKSEIIDENTEDDGAYAEYIHELPDTVNKKILELR